MYEFLKKLFGTGENGEPQAMTYEQLEAAINGSKDIKLVNLKDGGYVSQEKFDAKETELKGIQQQLADANTQIKSFEGEDIEGIKKKVTDWETKYQADTESLRKQMQEQETRHQRDMYFGDVKFASNAAKNGILMEFDKQGFQFKDGAFQGADSWLEKMKKDDPTAFVLEGSGAGNGATSSDNGAGAAQNQPTLPNFATKTSNGSGVGTDQTKPFHMNFMGVRKRPDQK